MVVTNKKIEFFVIPDSFQNEEIVKFNKPKFVFNKQKSAFKSAIFNPSKSHMIACSFCDFSIQIWSIRKSSIQKIVCSDIPIQMKWNENGYLLGYIDEINIIKIYNIYIKKEIFKLNLEEESISNFEFFGNDNLLVCNQSKDQIVQYKFEVNPKEGLKILDNKQYSFIYKKKYKFFFVYNDYLLIYSNNKRIKLFDDFNNNDILYEVDCPLNSPQIIRSSNKSILFKILDINNDNIVKLIILKDLKNENAKIASKKEEDGKEKSFKSDYDSVDNSFEDINQDYFSDCPNEFIDIKECFNFRYNNYDKEYQKEKKYLEIDEIKSNLENIKNENLIQRRKYVKEELQKNIKFKSIKEEYMFYINLLIKDETNIDLLLKYLTFLQKNKKELEKENLLHEKFYDELNYYSVFFEKTELKEKFNYDFESEKTKLINLLKFYSNSLKTKALEELKNKIEKDYINRSFNQPIVYEIKELIYYNCYKEIYDDICIKKRISEENLSKKIYAIDKILKKKIIENIESADILIPLISFICNSEKEENINFFLNMVNSKTLTNKELQQRKESLKCVLINNKEENGIVINHEYYEQSKELCFENLNNKNYQKCEKYNFKYLTDNPPLKLNINKIKNHLLFVLKSNVFKEVYKLLIGNDNYENIFNNEMISELISNIKFLPINFDTEFGILDCTSLVLYVSTMKKEIYSNYLRYDENISITLENGVIVAIIYHEFGHIINAVLAFIENKLKLNDTFRKKYINFKYGGYNLELALFGKVIKNLSYGEVLYILNEDNYFKSLDNFKKGFKELSNQDLIIKGSFNNFNLKKEKELDEYKSSIFIKAKNGNNIGDIYKDIKINIPLRNDVRGREIKEEDLWQYF